MPAPAGDHGAGSAGGERARTPNDPQDSPWDGPGERPWFEVVLHEPEIPNNTGTIGRTCVALGSRLHLVHPLGFDIDEKAVRRAGLDYWPDLVFREHTDWASCSDALSRLTTGAAWAFSSHGTRPVYDAPIAMGDAFVFGSESTGLPAHLAEPFARESRLLALPMRPGVRSINLSNAVTAVLYEGVRRAVVAGGLRIGPDGTLRAAASIR